MDVLLKSMPSLSFPLLSFISKYQFLRIFKIYIYKVLSWNLDLQDTYKTVIPTLFFQKSSQTIASLQQELLFLLDSVRILSWQ